MASNFYQFLKEEGKYLCNLCGQKFCNRISAIKKHGERKHNINFNLTTTLNRNQFLKCCVGIVSLKHVPFAIFDDEEFFKVLLDPYERHFGTNLSSKNIVKTVESACSTICDTLTKRLKNKLVSIKVDIATRLDRSIIGINVQYVRNFKIEINTLGMIQLRKQHTASVLRDEILKCLDKFGIAKSQIYSCTTDNGANILKASSMLQDEEDTTLETMTPAVVDDEWLYANLSTVMSAVRCAAHTIQLAAHDVLKTLTLEIKKCRSTVKKIRTALRTDDSGQRMPTLDNDTRWNSTYDMLCSLSCMKQCIEENYLGEEFTVDWDFIEKFQVAFEPLATCTKKLQAVQYVIGDFYRDWRLCEMQLRLLFAKTPFAEQLHNAMNNRTKILLENDAILAALYLDRRFNFKDSALLSNEQKSRAVEHLLNTYNLIIKMENGAACESNSLISESSFVDCEDVACSSSHVEMYEQMVTAECSGLSQPEPAAQSDRNAAMRTKLLRLSTAERAAFHMKVLDYSNMESLDEELQKLVEVVLAVPASQVSVERSFSALSVVLTKLRNKMNDTTLNAVLLTKLNFDLLRPMEVKLSHNNN